MKRLGLTGSIGSGKSTVAARFALRGAVVIDADRLARQATEDPAVLERIAATLGEDLVVEGRLDRSRTAERVFGDDDARETLNRIVHPEVRRLTDQRVRMLQEQQNPPPLVVHDVPLLFESGLERGFDATAVVVAPLELRVQRIVGRTGMTPEQARARDAAQMPQDEKARRATYVIDNGGPLEALEPQVDQIWSDLVDDRD